MSSQLSVLSGQTFSHEPGFVKLMEDDPGGIISCTTHPLKAQVSAFQHCSSFGVYLVVQTAPKQKVYIYRGQSSKGQNRG